MISYRKVLVSVAIFTFLYFHLIMGTYSGLYRNSYHLPGHYIGWEVRNTMQKVLRPLEKLGFRLLFFDLHWLMGKGRCQAKNHGNQHIERKLMMLLSCSGRLSMRMDLSGVKRCLPKKSCHCVKLTKLWVLYLINPKDGRENLLSRYKCIAIIMHIYWFWRSKMVSALWSLLYLGSSIECIDQYFCDLEHDWLYQLQILDYY